MIAAAGLDAVFARTKSEKRAALIMYMMAGYPDIQTSSLVLDAISHAGADLIELGIPYGDPLGDGPTIATAGQRALEAGITTDDALRLMSESNARGNAPGLFFTYVNPISQYGAARFARAARTAGAIGAIVPDVPLEELEEFGPDFAAAGLGLPLLVAPSTPPERAARIADRSEGFVYLVSRLGVTGARREPDFAWIEGAVGRLRAHSAKPIAVGFGLSRPEHVRRVGALADGVIVGSALIDAIGDLRGPTAAGAAGEYVRSLRGAL